MSAETSTGGHASRVSDTNTILVTCLLAALPAVLVLSLYFDGNLYAVFLSTLAMGVLPPYVYSKRSRRYGPGRAALWGLGVASAVFAVFLGLWVVLMGQLGGDGAALAAFLVVVTATYATLKIR